MHRYYFCPVVSDPKEPGNRVPLVMLYPHISASANVCVDRATGALSKTWALVHVEASDFTSIDADPQCVDILEKISDTAGQTKSSLTSWLKTTTVADLSVPAVARIKGRLASVGLDVSKIAATTPIFDLIDNARAALIPVVKVSDQKL